jgi:hypothetical protein
MAFGHMKNRFVMNRRRSNRHFGSVVAATLPAYGRE